MWTIINPNAGQICPSTIKKIILSERLGAFRVRRRWDVLLGELLEDWCGVEVSVCLTSMLSVGLWGAMRCGAPCQLYRCDSMWGFTSAVTQLVWWRRQCVLDLHVVCGVVGEKWGVGLIVIFKGVRACEAAQVQWHSWSGVATFGGILEGGGAQPFQSNFPITDIATYRLNQHRGQCSENYLKCITRWKGRDGGTITIFFLHTRDGHETGYV